METGELKGGETRAFQIPLKAGDFFNVAVNQKGIDVVVRLVSPEGKTVEERDSPTGQEGTELLSAILSTSGEYRLEILSLDKTAPSGIYELKVKVLRVATDQDRAFHDIETLLGEVEKRFGEGKYDDSLTLAAQALEKCEKTLGLEHPLRGECLHMLGILHRDKGDYDQAEVSFQQALAIKEKTVGAESASVARTLNQQAILYKTKADFPKAEILFQQALAMAEKTDGPESKLVGDCVNNLAYLYFQRGQLAKVEPLLLRARLVYEKVLGPEHTEVATILNNLGWLNKTKGDLAKAEPMFGQSLAIREKKLGPHHPDVAESLNNLAGLYQAKGDFIRALPAFEKALAIREKAFGSNHPLVSQSLNNLAEFLSNQGDFAQAEPLYQRALAINEKAFGSEHPEVAINLNNLAVLYRNKGDFAKAEPLFERSLAIKEKLLGPQTVGVAISLNNLASLYVNKGDYARAIPYYQKSLEIRKKVLGPENPTVAVCLGNLGGVYNFLGDYPQADSSFQQAAVIFEKTLGPDHVLTNNNLSNYAMTFFSKGDYQTSEKMFQQALVVRKKVLSPDHPSISHTLKELALVSLGQNHIEQAIAYQTQANETMERDFAHNLVTGSERQKLLYLNQTLRFMDLAISLHVNYAPANLEALRAAMLAALRRKGRGLDAMTASLTTLRRYAAPEDQKLLDDLASAKQQLATVSLRGPGREGPQAHQAQLKELTEKAEQAEARVSIRSAEYKVQTQPITLELIQKAIPADAVLVEFVTYAPYDSKIKRYGTPHYVGYILASTGNPQWVDLGEVEAIDKLTHNFRNALLKKIPLGQVFNLPGEKDAPQTLKILAQKLHQKVMHPILEKVPGDKRLLLSPDGALNVLPFGALIDRQGKFLIEHYRLTYLTSGRDLLRAQTRFEFRNPPMVLADPDYGQGGQPKIAGISLHPLARLVNTASEGLEIQQLYPQAVLKTKSAATKQTVIDTHRPQILHLATHGVFLSKSRLTANPEPEGRNVNILETPSFDLDLAKNEDPLLRSALFFAGANQGAATSGQTTLTALEAAQLDLWGTQLVVLSACETALGQVIQGDGVYGLRRALMLAGSESQVMSLWQVSDLGAKTLMSGLYQRLKNGEGRSDCLQNTQLQMLRSHRWKHPFYWAAFIQSGEWANLEGKR
ncbi:MAG: CHAT domain-containing protein [Acidobacteria bacterium]|nr:CHAT domain-containing protein [Acidobacteriota bacterium]